MILKKKQLKAEVDKDTILLGIDFGTGGCKVTIINALGEILSEASEEYETIHPKPAYCEQNPEDWFLALKGCLLRISGLNREILTKVGAISLDGSTHNAVLLDSSMKVLRPTIMWTDQRSVNEADYLEKGWGELIFCITHNRVSPTWTLPQLLWIKNNEPDNFKRIHRIMFVKDYVRYLLTGSWETDYIDAQGSQLFDVQKMKWSEEMCSLIGLPMEVLPPLCSPTHIVGTVSGEASEATGLKEGTPVVCGTTDVTAEDYGSGAVNEGQCILKIATAGNVNVMTGKATPTQRTITYSHVIPGLSYTAVATNTAAYAMRWFRDVFCSEELEESKRTGENVYQIIERKVKEIPPGCDGLIFHPYLLGERAPYWDPHLRASFVGATMSHKKGHFLRAVMEGVAFSLRDCYRLVDDMKLDVSEFIIIGGGAKSDTWAQIICDVFGKKIVKPCLTDASFGTALLAGVGTGVFADVYEAVSICNRTERVFIPDADNHIKYKKIFNLYLKIHDNTSSIYTEMNKLLS
jgi:xylulokinase